MSEHAKLLISHVVFFKWRGVIFFNFRLNEITDTGTGVICRFVKNSQKNLTAQLHNLFSHLHLALSVIIARRQANEPPNSREMLKGRENYENPVL